MTLPELDFSSGFTMLQVEWTVLNFESFGDGSLEIGGATFALSQFHFHTRSEHMIDGEQFTMVLHLVYTMLDGTTAVIARFIDPGENLDELDFLIDVIADMVESGAKTAFGGILDLSVFVPDNLETMSLRGLDHDAILQRRRPLGPVRRAPGAIAGAD